MPSLVRPQRPVRWLAEAWEIGLDRQPLHLGALAVAGDAGSARVDDVLDAGNREGRLGDIGGENRPAAGVRLEHPVLLSGRQPGVQRQDLQVRLVGQRVGGVPDLAFAAQEDQDVARSLAAEFGDGVGDGLNLIARLGAVRSVLASGIGEWPVPDFDRVSAAGNLDDRRG